jgi:hypothetical protein
LGIASDKPIQLLYARNLRIFDSPGVFINRDEHTEAEQLFLSDPMCARHRECYLARAGMMANTMNRAVITIVRRPD